MPYPNKMTSTQYMKHVQSTAYRAYDRVEWRWRAHMEAKVSLSLMKRPSEQRKALVQDTRRQGYQANLKAMILHMDALVATKKSQDWAVRMTGVVDGWRDDETVPEIFSVCRVGDIYELAYVGMNGKLEIVYRAHSVDVFSIKVATLYRVGVNHPIILQDAGVTILTDGVERTICWDKSLDYLHYLFI